MNDENLKAELDFKRLITEVRECEEFLDPVVREDLTSFMEHFLKADSVEARRKYMSGLGRIMTDDGGFMKQLDLFERVRKAAETLSNYSAISNDSSNGQE